MCGLLVKSKLSKTLEAYVYSQLLPHFSFQERPENSLYFSVLETTLLFTCSKVCPNIALVSQSKTSNPKSTARSLHTNRIFFICYETCFSWREDILEISLCQPISTPMWYICILYQMIRAHIEMCWIATFIRVILSITCPVDCRFMLVVPLELATWLSWF